MKIFRILKSFGKEKMSSVFTTSTCINNIPLIGLGTFRADDKNTLINAVKHAIKVGYRHLDCGKLI